MISAIVVQPLIPAMASTQPVDVFSVDKLLQKYDVQDPSELVEKLRQRSTFEALSHQELIDLGTVRFLQMQWEAAASIWESAGHLPRNPKEKASAFFLAASAHGMAKNWDEAGRLANLASLLAPESGEIVSARLAYWTNAGDQLETAIAADAMARMDLSLEGKEVLEPHTAFVIGIAIAGVITVLLTEDVEREAIGQILISIMAAVTVILSQA